MSQSSLALSVDDLNQLKFNISDYISFHGITLTDLIYNLVATLEQQPNSNTSSEADEEITLKLETINFIGEFCGEFLVYSNDVINKVLFTLLDSFIRNVNVKPCLLAAALTSATAVYLNYHASLDLTRTTAKSNGYVEQNGKTSTSRSVSIVVEENGIRHLEKVVTETLVKFLTHRYKVGYLIELTVLQCLIEFERSIPAVLIYYINILYEQYQGYHGPNKQLWSSLILISVRNFIKCVIRFSKVTQRGVSSVITRGANIPSYFTDVTGWEQLASFYSSFQQTSALTFNEKNSDVINLCKLMSDYVFHMEPCVQSTALKYLCEIKQCYEDSANTGDDKFFSPDLLQLSKRDSLILSLCALNLFIYTNKSSNSTVSAEQLRNNFEKCCKIPFRPHSVNIWYLKLVEVLSTVYVNGPLTNCKRILQPKITDSNSVLFEKICLYINISCKSSDSHGEHVLTLIKLFQKQINSSPSHAYVNRALISVLLLTYLQFPSLEAAIQVIIMELCSKFSFLCELITSFIKSLRKLEPNSNLANSILDGFTNHVDQSSLDYFLPRFADYLPLLTLVATNSSADLDQLLELVEKSVMLSDVCEKGSLYAGNGLLRVIQNALQNHKQHFYGTEVNCLLQYIINNFDNEQVKQLAQMYYKLNTDCTPTQISQFFRSLPQDSSPTVSDFERFMAATCELKELVDQMDDLIELKESSLDTIFLTKLPPRHQAELCESSCEKVMEFDGDSAVEYLCFEPKPKTIRLLFLVSVSDEAQYMELHAVEFLIDFEPSLTLLDSTHLMIWSLDQKSQPHLMSIDFEVNDVVESSLQISARFNDLQLNSCYCRISDVPIEFQNYFQPLCCKLNLKQTLFVNLWNYFKQKLALEEESSAMDLIYHIDCANSWRNLNSTISKYFTKECIVNEISNEMTSEYISAPKREENVIEIGVYLPTDCHMLMKVTHYPDFTVFHTIISHEKLFPLMTNFLHVFESSYKYS